jgi:hypothetical protein
MKQSKSNVEIFNRICIYLLSELYDSFPVPIAIDPDRIGLKAIPEELDFDGAWSVMDIANETFIFLHQEGFVTEDTPVTTGEHSNVRLTMKGLAILGVPVSLGKKEEEKAIIDRIKKIIEKGAENSATQSVQAVVSAVFKMALG